MPSRAADKHGVSTGQIEVSEAISHISGYGKQNLRVWETESQLIGYRKVV